jgi:hypothetical protein
MEEGAVWHIGRGGAAKRTASRPDASRKEFTSSVDSSGSVRSEIFGGLSHTFERH